MNYGRGGGGAYNIGKLLIENFFRGIPSKYKTEFLSMIIPCIFIQTDKKTGGIEGSLYVIQI